MEDKGTNILKLRADQLLPGDYVVNSWVDRSAKMVLSICEHTCYNVSMYHLSPAIKITWLFQGGVILPQITDPEENSFLVFTR
jgi:hypothetical protein